MTRRASSAWLLYLEEVEQEKLDKAKREANFCDLTVDNDVEARPDDTEARLALRQQQQTEALAAVAWWQGLTLVRFSAQRKRLVWDRGCM